MENKIWITFFLMLAGLFGWVANDVVVEQNSEVTFEVKDCETYGIILLYTEEKKYMCEGCIGPTLVCTETEEILSELG